MKDLASRVAIVTGAGSGIGRGIALGLAGKGTRVLAADLDSGRAEAVREEIEAAGGTAIASACDVGQPEQVEALRDLALGELGRLDVVVSNVGVHAHGLPEHVPAAEWERVLKVNVGSVVSAIRTFVPHFLAQGDGYIVNVASVNGLFPFTYDRLPYTASKAAIVAFSESLALYLRPRGVGVSCLCPGSVANTNIVEHMPYFGPERVAQGPVLRQIEPSEVAARLIEAIESETFLVMTHDEVWELMRRRATEHEAFLREQTAKVAEHDAENGQL